MRRVILESPFEGGTERELDNRRYLQACIADSLARGEAPFASHAIYPGALDDTVPAERVLGIAAGFAWRSVAQATVVYIDRGITRGMREGIAHAREHYVIVEYRSIRSWAQHASDVDAEAVANALVGMPVDSATTRAFGGDR